MPYKNMLYLQKFIQKDKPRIDAKIKAYYNSFKKFMCCENLPDFNIEYVDSRMDKSVFYYAQICLYQSNIVLRYNIALLDERNISFKATLVHEFTHLYDHYILSKQYNDAFLQRNLYLYSEKHASEIEILFCYGIISKITDNANIIYAKTSDIINLPLQKVTTYENICLEFIHNKSLINFNKIKTAYMYAIGASSILSQLTNRPVKAINFIDKDCAELNNAVQMLMKLRYYETPSKEFLEKLGDVNELLNSKYVKGAYK